MTPKNFQESEIINFYENSKILITGGTGFLGRVLISKLLRSCKSVERIYLIIRDKKGKPPSLRYKELLEDSILSNLKHEIPDVESRITFIPGDCGLPGLGLDENDRKLITKEITHIFHAAATVKFDEELKTAIAINVRGVEQMLKLCRSCENLKSFVYVSSTYAHCVRSTVTETLYDPPIKGKDVLYLIDNFSPERLELIKNSLIQPWPNTYNFSKAVAEDIIKEDGEMLPIGIFRPSIVIGTSEEPVPGWINNLYGPTGVVAGVGAGFLRVLKVDTTLKADLVPVDMTVNALICAAWDIHKKHKSKTENLTPQSIKQPPVYNFVTSEVNPVTWNDYLYYSMKYGMKIPPLKATWYITLTTTKREALYKTLLILFHLLPALMIDGYLKIAGKKARLLQTYKKIHKFSDVISFFTTKEWLFRNTQIEELWHHMSEVDRNVFNFNMNTLDWNSYFERTIFGLRKYLFNEDPSTIPLARKRMFWLLICHRVMQVVVGAVCLWFTFHIMMKGYSLCPSL